MVAFCISRGGLVFGGCHLLGLGGWVGLGGCMIGFSDARDLTIFFYFSYVYFQTWFFYYALPLSSLRIIAHHPSQLLRCLSFLTMSVRNYPFCANLVYESSLVTDGVIAHLFCLTAGQKKHGFRVCRNCGRVIRHHTASAGTTTALMITVYNDEVRSTLD